MNATPFVVARDLVGRVLPGEAATIRAAQEAIDGHRKGLRALWPFLGPAFIASVAYVDPGNFATDVAGGAKYGYLLLWAVLAANLMAMLVQSMSAKLGIATGRNLPEVCRERFPRSVSFGLWIQAEIVAMATDIAEFMGAAIGLNLLFGIPLFPAALITSTRFLGLTSESASANPAERAAVKRSTASIHFGVAAVSPARGRPASCLNASATSSTDTTFATMTVRSFVIRP